jgi:choline dehydrogenase-like flavoprotein
LRRFNYYAGYGVALIDTPAESNAIGLDPKGNLVVNYRLSSADAERFRRGVAIAAKMMLLAGAQDVVIPSNENILGLPDFDPMRGVIINRVEQTDLILRNLQFTPNRTFLIGAHLQAANKMGPSAQTAVVSTRQRLWATSGAEIENVYLMDSSIFPTSIGANPMQSIYTFAKIFCDRLLNGAI